MVVQAYDSNLQESEAGVLLYIQSQSSLCKEFPDTQGYMMRDPVSRTTELKMK